MTAHENRLTSAERRESLDARFASIDPDGQTALDARLTPLLSGAARIERLPGGLRLTAGPTTAHTYCNAQLDDYHRLRPRDYLWRAPLVLHARARASRAAWPASAPATEAGEYLRGTAGFGFWNASFSLAGGPPRLPDAVWFFSSSPPSNMALMPGAPGYGWKAQVVHAHRPGALAAAAPLVAAMLWAKLGGREELAARWLNRLTGTREAPLDPQLADLRDWHDYEIEWREDAARFRVDGQEVLNAPAPPRGPLGLVIWIDTQYAIVTPRGRLRFGALATDEQWLELATLRIQPL